MAKCVRVTYDSTVLYDDMSNGGGIACDIENAIRMNADCMAVQTFIGAPGESVPWSFYPAPPTPEPATGSRPWGWLLLESRWRGLKSFSF